MNIKDYELAMWDAALNRDAAAFSALVCDDAVMLCGGYRCSGREYASFLSNFGLAGYEITAYETVYACEDFVQTHSVVQTTVNRPEDADLAGVFYVVSSWKRFGNEWRLIFNMDSRTAQSTGE